MYPMDTLLVKAFPTKILSGFVDSSLHGLQKALNRSGQAPQGRLSLERSGFVIRISFGFRISVFGFYPYPSVVKQYAFR